MFLRKLLMAVAQVHVHEERFLLFLKCLPSVFPFAVMLDVIALGVIP